MTIYNWSSNQATLISSNLIEFPLTTFSRFLSKLCKLKLTNVRVFSYIIFNFLAFDVFLKKSSKSITSYGSGHCDITWSTVPCMSSALKVWTNNTQHAFACTFSRWHPSYLTQQWLSIHVYFFLCSTIELISKKIQATNQNLNFQRNSWEKIWSGTQRQVGIIYTCPR